MDYLKNYNINFSGLKAGMHEFGFVVDNKFFEQFEKAEIEECSINVHVSLHKEEGMLTLFINIDGTINVMCDRCLDFFNMNISDKTELFIKLGAEYKEVEDNTIVIPRDEEQYNISQFLYEYIHLLLPISKSHETDAIDGKGCDASVLKKLEELHPGSQEKNPGEIDPRWEALKKLKY